jgi:uncharacterized protein YecE (DUF72 family)
MLFEFLFCMRFGAVPDHTLESLDLRLPPEPPQNAAVLPGRRATPKVYVGAATWGAASWAGKLYPPKTPASRFRALYPQFFNAIELNATHYTFYAPEVIRQWAAVAEGKDFKFCPKFPQAISHHSDFKNAQPQTDAFLESIWAFENHLGPAFLQVSESFSPLHKDALYTYLATLPAGGPFFLEVRHPLWMSDAAQKADLFQTCRRCRSGAVITDTPGRRDLVHMHVTVPAVFCGLYAMACIQAPFSRADAWIQQLYYWIRTRPS